jgi:glycosyltransferase involved in cell wall biosynthesis
MGRQWKEYRERVERGLRAADLVTAPSAAMLCALEKHYGAFNAAAPVYNGRCAAEFPPGLKEPIVLAAGRLWDDAKNLRILESVAPALSWPIYVAGEERAPGSDQAAQFTALIRLGALDRAALSRWLSCAAIFAHPAIYEPFGLAVLEAALAGCALVLGDIPSLREIWGDAALFVPPNDSGAALAALENLIASPERRKSFARAARRRALQFSPARMANEYMQLYRKLTAKEVPAVQAVPSLRSVQPLPRSSAAARKDATRG